MAAGTSSRMGQNKLLLKYKSHTIIEEVLHQLSNSSIDNILVVTGYENKRMERLITKNLKNKVRIVHNSNYMFGRSESIKCAIRHSGNNTDAILFMVADKPTITGELVNKAIEEFKQHMPAILYIKTPSGRGHPIIFSKKLFPELLSLEGDTVGEKLIARHKAEVVELEDEQVQMDINTKEDYKILLESIRLKE